MPPTRSPRSSPREPPSRRRRSCWRPSSISSGRSSSAPRSPTPSPGSSLWRRRTPPRSSAPGWPQPSGGTSSPGTGVCPRARETRSWEASVGAALIEGGTGAVNWGGFDGLRPVGVFGALVALAISPPLGALGALIVIQALRRAARRATRRLHGPVNGGQWVMSAALAFSHGANDAQKSIGVIAALLLAAGEIDTFAAPTWVTLACAAALTIGHFAGRMADHPYRGPPHLPDPARGGPRQPERIGGRDLRCLAARRPDLHHAGRRFVARRDRRRTGPAAPRPLAPREEMGFAWLITIPITALLAMGAYEIWSWVA